ncbi:MAG TPA: hypothetical protein VKZ52_06740 [Burkholderiaceae bacterium]|nr:hypothetical protein [Burkholderiaceae bacterium]
MASQYGALERRIARMLSDFPLLKSCIKLSYARAAYLLSGGRATRPVTRTPLRRVGAEGVETFFGYYDKSPLSDEGWLLCHASPFPTSRPPHAMQPIAVQVYDFKAGRLSEPVLSLETRAYNWQQGARALWLDGDHFIFNDFDPEAQRYIARVVCVSTRREVHQYALPVQDAWQRAYFLSLNYRRLQTLRPDYGYRNLPPLDDAALATLSDDGIWHVEQASGSARLLYSLRDVCDTATEPEFEQAHHKLNHVMIGPDGQQFIFLHRYFLGRRKFDRLMLGSTDGAPLRVLAAHGMVSHCFWADDHTLLCYARGPSGFDGYYTLDLTSGEMVSLFNGALDALGDGHPHVHGHWFVTDTYPDRRRMQHLMRGNLRTGQVETLGSFHQSFRYGGETRCDLHPRISGDGRTVFFDSVCEGRRRLYFLEASCVCLS